MAGTQLIALSVLPFYILRPYHFRCTFIESFHWVILMRGVQIEITELFIPAETMDANKGVQLTKRSSQRLVAKLTRKLNFQSLNKVRLEHISFRLKSINHFCFRCLHFKIIPKFSDDQSVFAPNILILLMQEHLSQMLLILEQIS